MALIKTFSTAHITKLVTLNESRLIYKILKITTKLNMKLFTKVNKRLSKETWVFG